MHLEGLFIFQLYPFDNPYYDLSMFRISMPYKKLLAVIVSLVACTNADAIYCNGKVSAVYKWASFSTLSVQIQLNDGSLTRWISLPTKSDEAMVLVALTTGRPIELYWDAPDISICVNGWEHNRVLTGFIVLKST